MGVDFVAALEGTGHRSLLSLDVPSLLLDGGSAHEKTTFRPAIRPAKRNCRFCGSEQMAQHYARKSSRMGFSRIFGDGAGGENSAGRPLDRSGRVQDALPQQIEVGPAVHLPFEHLQPVDLSLCLAIAPRQEECGVDGGMVTLEVVGKMDELLDSGATGPLQPAIQVVGVAITKHTAEGISQASEV